MYKSIEITEETELTPEREELIKKHNERQTDLRMRDAERGVISNLHFKLSCLSKDIKIADIESEMKDIVDGNEFVENYKIHSFEDQHLIKYTVQLTDGRILDCMLNLDPESGPRGESRLRQNNEEK